MMYMQPSFGRIGAIRHSPAEAAAAEADPAAEAAEAAIPAEAAEVTGSRCKENNCREPA